MPAVPPWLIRPAQPDEWSAALALLLGADLPREQLPAAVAIVVQHLQRGTLDPAAFFIATDGRKILGAILGQHLPGAQALLFDVPHTVAGHPSAEPIKDALLHTLLDWLRARQVKLVQCLLTLSETVRATSLLRCGFHYVTELHYQRHFLEDLPPASWPGLAFQLYEPSQQQRLADLITATYVETLDCPELNGVRSMEEVIEGHERTQPGQPPLWWIEQEKAQDVGVLLLQPVTAENVWDVVYMGVLPEVRRRGLGRRIMHFALHQAKEAEIQALQLCVDARNLPAVRLYNHLGFVPWEVKALFLAILSEEKSTPLS
jgi:ribosomal protein S18 acetylase RimI-like enzyme